MSQYHKRAVSVIIFLILTFQTLLCVCIGCFASTAPLNQAPPSDLDSISTFTMMPIQAAWNPDINNDGRIDLVLRKPMAVVLNTSGADPPVTAFDVTYELQPYSTTHKTEDVFTIWPIVPQNTGNFTLTGSYTDAAGVHDLTPVTVTVKATSGLSLSYYFLYRQKLRPTPHYIDYGWVNEEDYGYMVGNSTEFINATYPIADPTTEESHKGILGTTKNRRDPFKALLDDALAAAQDAEWRFGGSGVGVAIGPNDPNFNYDYFEYHGFPGAAGISFGPSVKGVVVLDGYYTGAAHEVGHTYGLYWGEPEQYQIFRPDGRPASGVWVTEDEWRTGICFMGLGVYRTLNDSWVHTETYEELFNETRTIPDDPEILLANGIIYKNRTVEFSLPWYRMAEGTPDTLMPGDFALRFLDADKEPLTETSFDASFFVYIEPTMCATRVTTKFGKVETDMAAFSFATVYPSGTSTIQVLNKTDPQNPVIAKVDARDIKTVRADADGPYVKEEGSAVTFNASGSFSTYQKELRYRWDFNGDMEWDTEWSTEPTASYTWKDDWYGTAVVNVTDGYTFDMDTATVVVSNVAPIAEAGENQIVIRGKEISFIGKITDPGDDTHTIVWDFGDGITATGTLNPAHTYVNRGIFKVTLNVTDDDGGAALGTLTITAIPENLTKWIIIIIAAVIVASLSSYYIARAQAKRAQAYSYDK